MGITATIIDSAREGRKTLSPALSRPAGEGAIPAGAEGGREENQRDIEDRPLTSARSLHQPRQLVRIEVLALLRALRHAIPALLLRQLRDRLPQQRDLMLMS